MYNYFTNYGNSHTYVFYGNKVMISDQPCIPYFFWYFKSQNSLQPF